jgi:acetyl-CoA acyltransferase
VDQPAEDFAASYSRRQVGDRGPVAVASTRILGLDPEIVNVSGSGSGLGHPVAATGGRMTATLLGDLHRRGGGIGVAALCAGGMGSALVIEAF